MAMTMHLGERMDDTMLFYERSRFRATVVGVIITSVLTMGLGMFVWPVLRDFLYSQFGTLQTTAMVLGGAFAVMVVVWLYSIVRMFVRFHSYSRNLQKFHRGRLLGSIALATALLCAVLVPVVIFVFDPIH